MIRPGFGTMQMMEPELDTMQGCILVVRLIFLAQRKFLDFSSINRSTSRSPPNFFKAFLILFF